MNKTFHHLHHLRHQQLLVLLILISVDEEEIKANFLFSWLFF